MRDLNYANYPQQIFIDTWNNIYIADASNHNILKVDSITGELSRVAGDGTRLNLPAGVAMSPNQRLAE